MVRIAIVQEDSKFGDKADNLNTSSSLIARAAMEGAHLVLFPELFLTGYSLKKGLRELAEEISGPSIARLANLAETNRIHICMGFAERDSQSASIFNSLVCLSEKGKILAVYRKVHLFDAEKNFFTPGNEIVIAETAIGPLGFSICYDLEFPEWSRLYALQGAHLLLVANANMYPWCAYQEVYAKARAMENQMFLAMANRVGISDDFRFCGESLIIDPTGNVLKKANGEGPSLLVANLNIKRMYEIRKSSINYFRDRRADLYGLIGK